MNVTTLFQQINTAYRGTDDDPPAIGTTDGDEWLLTANRKKDEWARAAKQSWQSNFLLDKPNEPGTVATTATTALTGTSTYFSDYRVGDTILVSGETVRTIATIPSNTSLTVTVAFSNTASAKTFTHQTIIATGVQSYSVHRSFLTPATSSFGSLTAQDIRYRISRPQENDRFTLNTYLSGRGPQILTFQDNILSGDQIVGGTLKMPGFYIPDDMAAATDIVPVDDPYWLVYATASELAFNDLTYSDKAPDLNAKANNLYSQMAQNNRRGTSGYPRTARTNVDRIRDTSDSTRTTS